MIEKTLLLVKPEGVSRALIGKVISTIEDAGLKIVAIKMVIADKKTAGEHYFADPAWMESVGNKSISSYKDKGIVVKESAKEIGAKIRDQLINHLTSGPVIAMVVEGNEAIFISRKLVGLTEPRKADPSTIRGRYGSDSYDAADVRGTPILNLVHASEDKKTAEKEIPLWFKKNEIISYKRVDQHLFA